MTKFVSPKSSLVNSFIKFRCTKIYFGIAPIIFIGGLGKRLFGPIRKQKSRTLRTAAAAAAAATEAAVLKTLYLPFPLFVGD